MRPTHIREEKVKKNNFYLWVMMTVAVMCIGFTSCGDDDDDNNSSTSKAMVGYWNVSTLDYSMVLFDNGVMKGMAHGSNEITTGNWSYDSQTNTLATSALYNGKSLQWLITMLNTNNWTGVALWNDKNTTYMADNKENELDAYELNLLLDGKWVSKTGNTIIFYSIKSSGSKSVHYNISFNDDPANLIRSGGTFNIFTKAKDKIFLDENYPYDKYTIQIINPYNYKNRQIEIVFGEPKTLGVYYFQD